MIYGELAMPLTYEAGIWFETRSDMPMDKTVIYLVETSTENSQEVLEQLEAETLELDTSEGETL